MGNVSLSLLPGEEAVITNLKNPDDVVVVKAIKKSGKRLRLYFSMKEHHNLQHQKIDADEKKPDT